MIIVTGSIVATVDRIDEALRLSVEHVQRSRKEPGCMSHAVSCDAENPLHLVFFEEWADRAALTAHFAVPESRAFVKALAMIAAEAPSMKLYDATLVPR